MCIPTNSAVTGVPFPVLRQSLSEQTILYNVANDPTTNPLLCITFVNQEQDSEHSSRALAKLLSQSLYQEMTASGPE